MTGAYRHASYYTLLMGGAAVLSVAQSLLFAKALSPDEFGFYTIAAVVVSYGVVLQGGMLSGLAQSLPVAIGAGDAAGAAALVRSVRRALSYLSSAAVGLATVVVLLHTGAVEPRIAMWLGVVVAATDQPFQLGMIRLRSARRVLAFPLVLLAQKTILVIVGASAAVFFGYKGPLVAWSVANLLLAVIVSRVLHDNAAPAGEPDRRVLRGLVVAGVPIVLAGFLDNFRLSLDRVFIASIATPAELGLYHFAATPLALGLVATGIINQYTSPQLLHEYGGGLPLRSVFLRSIRIAAALAVGATAVGAGLLVVAAPSIAYALPAYQGSVPLLPFFVAAMVFAVTTSAVGVTIIAARRQLLHLACSLSSAVVSAIGYVVVRRAGGDLAAYATIAVLAVAWHAAALIWLSWWCVRDAERTFVATALPQVAPVLEYKSSESV